MLVGDRERVAVDPIPGPELAFEIRGPEVVGRRRDRIDKFAAPRTSRTSADRNIWGSAETTG